MGKELLNRLSLARMFKVCRQSFEYTRPSLSIPAANRIPNDYLDDIILPDEREADMSPVVGEEMQSKCTVTRMTVILIQDAANPPTSAIQAHFISFMDGKFVRADSDSLFVPNPAHSTWASHMEDQSGMSPVVGQEVQSKSSVSSMANILTFR